MAVYGYTHAIIESIEKYFSEHDIQALVLEQLASMHVSICDSNEHVKIKKGHNKGKCKYCLKAIRYGPKDI